MIIIITFSGNNRSRKEEQESKATSLSKTTKQRKQKNNLDGATLEKVHQSLAAVCNRKIEGCEGTFWKLNVILNDKQQIVTVNRKDPEDHGELSTRARTCISFIIVCGFTINNHHHHIINKIMAHMFAFTCVCVMYRVKI